MKCTSLYTGLAFTNPLFLAKPNASGIIQPNYQKKRMPKTPVCPKPVIPEYTGALTVPVAFFS